jgi:O-succinylbenzoic acid--CoA ligase
VSSLRPVAGTVTGLLDALRDFEAASSEPEPLIVATSGSTGEPKQVVLSRAALRASADATAARLGGPGQWLLTLPPDHVAGLQVLFRSVRAGTEPVVERPAAGELPDLAAAAARMTGQRRHVSVVPTQLRRLLADPAAREVLAGFTTVLVGGAGVPEELRAEARDAGVRLVASYGMSETCGGCVYDGVPLDGVAVALDVGGRIRIGGPTLFSGYAGRPDLTAEVLRDGWFHTEDLGRLDEDGRLQVIGRRDDVVVTGGLNVPAPAVAARLAAHPAVRDVAVLGVPDQEWGHRVVAFVVGELGLDEARDWVADVHPRAWSPRSVLRLPALPLLPNGKVDRRRLEELAR